MMRDDVKDQKLKLEWRQYLDEGSVVFLDVWRHVVPLCVDVCERIFFALLSMSNVCTLLSRILSLG